ncbi:MAG TPA: hypothetical protein PJ988_02135 [Anaerolinea sp.]|nr:hypothetical protein [Anaerolinea sp.]
MRRQKTFLLTVIPAEEAQQEFCGQIKSVSSGRAYNFSNLADLRQFISSEIEAEISNHPQVDVVARDIPAAIEPI